MTLVRHKSLIVKRKLVLWVVRWEAGVEAWGSRCRRWRVGWGIPSPAE